MYIGIKVLLYVLIADLHFGFLKNGVLYDVWTAVEHLWIVPHGFPTERIETSGVLRYVRGFPDGVGFPDTSLIFTS